MELGAYSGYDTATTAVLCSWEGERDRERDREREGVKRRLRTRGRERPKTDGEASAKERASWTERNTALSW